MHRRTEQEERRANQGGAASLRHPFLHGHPEHPRHEDGQRLQLYHPGDPGRPLPLRDHEDRQGEEEEAERDDVRRPEVVHAGGAEEERHHQGKLKGAGLHHERPHVQRHFQNHHR